MQLLPIQEFGAARSLGYNGTDYFSPEMDYAVQPSDPEFQTYLDEANRLLAARARRRSRRMMCPGRRSS